MSTPSLLRRPLTLLSIGLVALLAPVLSACSQSGLAVAEGWSGPALAGNNLFIGARDGHVVALDRTKFGAASVVSLSKKELDKNPQYLLWRFPAGGQKLDILAIYSNPVVANDVVYVAVNRLVAKNSRKGNLYALKAADGAQLWSGPFITEGQVYSSPILQSGTLFLTDDEGWLYAVDASSGQKKWAQRLSDKRLWASPVFADGNLYVSGMDKQVYALNAETGNELWTVPYRAGAAITSSPLVVGELLYVGAFDRELHVLDRATGRPKGTFKTADWIWNDAVTADGIIYFGTLGGQVFALRAATLAQVWQYPPTEGTEEVGAIRANPIVDGNRLLIAGRNGAILVLNRQSGALLSSTSVESKVLASMATSGDGRLYVSDINQKLHEINLPKG